MATICVFGDSIAWGANDPQQGGWVGRLRNYYQSQNLRADNDTDVYNLGVSGDNTDDLLKRFNPELVARLSDDNNIVIFAIGINDSQYVVSKGDNRIPVDQFRSNLQTLVSAAKKHTNKIIFIGLTRVDESKTAPIPWNTDKKYTNAAIEKYDGIIQSVAKEEGVNYIGMQDVVGLADLTDGLHPNPEGHKKMFEAISVDILKEKWL